MGTTISVGPASYLLVNIHDAFQSENPKGNFFFNNDNQKFSIYTLMKFDNHFTSPE